MTESSGEIHGPDVPKLVKSESCDENHDSKSTAYSCKCIYHGVVEVVVKSNATESLMDVIGRCLLRSLVQPDHYVFEFSPASIYRSTQYLNFTIEKTDRDRVESPVIMNFELSRVSRLFSLEISGDKVGSFNCIAIKEDNLKTFYVIVLSLRSRANRDGLFRWIRLSREEVVSTCNAKVDELIIEEDVYNYTLSQIEATAEIYEPDTSGELCAVNREKDVFKVRRNVPKLVEIIIHPTKAHSFIVERCFGLLYMKEAQNSSEQMKLFDEFMFEKTEDVDGYKGVCYRHRVNVGVGIKTFDLFENEPDSEVGNFLVASDLVVKGVTTPVRLAFRVKVRTYPEKEKFWLTSKRKVWYNTLVYFRRNTHSKSPDVELVTTESVSLDKGTFWRSNFDALLNSKPVSSAFCEELGRGARNEDDEPLLSGSYSFSPDISNEILAEWTDSVFQWKDSQKPPSNLQKLLKYGVPCSHRKYVWPFLVGIYNKDHKCYSIYEDLRDKSSEYEKVISNDVTRTFPSNDYFKEYNGEGQQKLYRVCKAYSLYDNEAGYCQGLSFISAALLLNVDEATAFGILVELMFSLNHRQLYLRMFDPLHSHLFVLKRLICDRNPELGKHFATIGVEPHMYAPQWFLTIFTAKFPLGLVDQAVDMVLSMGVRAIFQISLSMIQMCSNELTTLDFEETLKYFRETLPKKFVSPSSTKKLFSNAHALSLSPSMIEELELDYQRYKKDIILTQDPLDLMKAENRMLFENQLRLEQENNLLAQELVSVQINSKKMLAEVHDEISEIKQKNETLKLQEKIWREMSSRQLILLEEKTKELEQKSLHCDDNLKKKEVIIQEYKRICSTFEEREQKLFQCSNEYEKILADVIGNCETCKKSVDDLFPGSSVPKIRDNLNCASHCGLSKGETIKMDKDESTRRIEELEMHLAHAKMKIAEAETKNEELERNVNLLLSEPDKPWFLKMKNRRK